MDRRTGKCLCGAVTFTATPLPSSQACHCETCRTWGGGPFMAVPCTSAEFDGPVTRYRSSEHAERGFCPTCGTHLFFNPIGKPVYGIPIDIFENDSELPFKAEFFIDEKPERYSFAQDTKKMTGAEFIAKFRG